MKIAIVQAVSLSFILLISGCESKKGSQVESANVNVSSLSPNQANSDAQSGVDIAKLNELAEKSNSSAQYHMGMLYNNGVGVKQDPQQAFDSFVKAHNNGDKLGSFKVGCYYAGQCQYGVLDADIAKALEYDLIAAEGGYSLAQEEVGNMYFQLGQYDNALGQYDNAIKWWKKAADQGDYETLRNLSHAYYEGKVVPRDNVLSYFYAKATSLSRYPDSGDKLVSGYADSMTSEEITKAEQMSKTGNQSRRI